MDHTHHQWYRQMQRALQLSGKSPNTQESYLRSVRQVADHCGKDPGEISDQELADHILFRRNDSQWKPATLRLVLPRFRGHPICTNPTNFAGYLDTTCVEKTP